MELSIRVKAQPSERPIGPSGYMSYSACPRRAHCPRRRQRKPPSRLQAISPPAIRSGRRRSHSRRTTMLYDPKWERPPVNSMMRLRAWLAMQDPHASYNWMSCAECAVAQYLTAQLGEPKDYGEAVDRYTAFLVAVFGSAK